MTDKIRIASGFCLPEEKVLSACAVELAYRYSGDQDICQTYLF